MTVVVVVAVLAAPSLVACSRSPEGFAACLRQRIVDAGFLPPGDELPTQVTAETPDTADRLPVDDGGLAITLLRAEPDGSVVIAGSSSPHARIVVYADDTPLGTTEAEASGDWVLVPETPLASGGVEITVGQAGDPQRPDQAFVVVIDPERAAEPLVIATTRDEAGRIVEGLPLHFEAPPPVGISGTPEAPDEEPLAPDREALETAGEGAAGMPVPAPAPLPEMAVVGTVTPIASAAAGATAAAEVSPPPVPLPEIVVVATATPIASAAAEARAAAGVSPVVPATSLDVAATASQAASLAAGMAASVDLSPAPTIDAIEIDGTVHFFAGGGAEGATVRLFVDGRHVGDAEVADGRWLVEARETLTGERQRVRVEQLRPGTAEVGASVEVEFAIDMPEPEGAAEGPAEMAAGEGEAPPAAAEAVAHLAAAWASAVPGLAVNAGAVAAPEAAAVPAFTWPERGDEAEERQVRAAGAAVETAAGPDGTPVARIGVVSAPTAAVEVLPTDSASAPPSAAARKDVAILKAVLVAGPDAGRYASGKAIIRRGDTLWAIARRVYGKGSRYMTIYRANRDKIRDPSRIYPGQVLDLPLVFED